MEKIHSLEEISKWVKQKQKSGKTVGLVTGCFDVIHYGHVDLFIFAKSRVDILVVGLENDKTIRLSKGSDRPFFDETTRAKMLAALETIDKIFIFKPVYRFNSLEAQEIHESLWRTLEPDFIITNKIADKYWKIKRDRSAKLGIKIILTRRIKRTSTTAIAGMLKKEL